MVKVSLVVHGVRWAHVLPDVTDSAAGTCRQHSIVAAADDCQAQPWSGRQIPVPADRFQDLLHGITAAHEPVCFAPLPNAWNAICDLGWTQMSLLSWDRLQANESQTCQHQDKLSSCGTFQNVAPNAMRAFLSAWCSSCSALTC